MAKPEGQDKVKLFGEQLTMNATVGALLPMISTRKLRLINLITSSPVKQRCERNP